MRVDSARRLDAWLRPARDGEAVVLLGDFNAYAQEDPLRVLREAGWVDPFAHAANLADEYSFVFDGASGRLDHVLLNPTAAARLGAAAHWHSSADEPPSAASDASAYGASDHDPLVIGLDP
jgi:predicted extracellular nuclease